MDSLTIRLPEPPSANAYYRMAVIHRSPRMLLSRDGRKYKESVRDAWAATPGAVLTSFYRHVPLALTIEWHRGRKSGDLDNRLKPVIDSLKGLAFVDDDQVVQILAKRLESPRNPYCVVTIQTLDPTD